MRKLTKEEKRFVISVCLAIPYALFLAILASSALDIAWFLTQGNCEEVLFLSNLLCGS